MTNIFILLITHAITAGSTYEWRKGYCVFNPKTNKARYCANLRGDGEAHIVTSKGLWIVEKIDSKTYKHIESLIEKRDKRAMKELYETIERDFKQ